MIKVKNSTSQNKKENKIRKYIVEAPEPKKGQKVSSGGIRENGKLASQFKNPIPYEEPILPPAVSTQRLNSEINRKEQARTRRNEVGSYLLYLAWQEFGEPLLRSGLHKLSNTIINRIESPTNHPIQRVSSPEPKVINIEADEIETVYDDNKTIHSPNRKVV